MRRLYRAPKQVITTTSLGGITRRGTKQPQKIPGFYGTPEWRELRKKVFKRYGRRCMACGNLPPKKYDVCVDHIEPRSKRPDLELEMSNLQVLCRPCNERKSDKHSTSYHKETVWFASLTPEEITVATAAILEFRKTKPPTP